MKALLTILITLLAASSHAQLSRKILLRNQRIPAPAGGGGGGSWTFGAKNSAAGVTPLGVQLAGVSAGHFIVAFVKHEGAPTTIAISDGTSSLTGRTKVDHSNIDLSGQLFYLPSSVASGTVTYTVTLGAARPALKIFAMRFSYTGTASYDSEATGGGGINTSVTTHTSGATLTTTGTAELVVSGYPNYSGEASSARQIVGVAEDGFQAESNDIMFYRILSGTVSSAAATCTTAAPAASVIPLAAFKAQ